MLFLVLSVGSMHAAGRMILFLLFLKLHEQGFELEISWL
jgi:hypothetical protein